MDLEYSSQIQVHFQHEKVQNQCEHRTKTSKYEKVFGKTEENYRLAKLRFKNSVLMPPPPKIEGKYKDLLQNAKDKYKRRLNKIFTNISRKDSQAKTNFHMKNCFNRKKDYLDQRELQNFFKQIKFDIESRFKSFIRTTEDYFKDDLYQQMKKCINAIRKWVKMIENRVQTMYYQRIQSANLMKDLLQKYNWYSKFVPLNYLNQNFDQTDSQCFQRQLTLSNIRRIQKQITDLQQKQSTPKLMEYILNQRNFRNNFVLESDSGSNTDNDN